MPSINRCLSNALRREPVADGSEAHLLNLFDAIIPASSAQDPTQQLCMQERTTRKVYVADRRGV
jgi:hypothetical protein